MNDLIYRAAAIGCLGNSPEQMCMPWSEVERMLRELPAVDAVPVIHGEWIEEPDREGHYHCSNCGVVWGVSAMAMKHCPNCTAKMTNSPLWDMEDEAATEMAQYCECYEPTYNPDDGSM